MYLVPLGSAQEIPCIKMALYLPPKSPKPPRLTAMGISNGLSASYNGPANYSIYPTHLLTLPVIYLLYYVAKAHSLSKEEESCHTRTGIHNISP